MRYLLALLCSFFLLVGCNGGSEDSSASPLPTEAEQTSTSISAQDIVSMQMQLEYDKDITNNEIRSGFQQQFCLIGADTDTPISEGVILTPGAPGQCSSGNDDESNVVYAEIEWASSNNQVANVDENGNFSAVSPGNVIITANLVGYEVSCALELVITEPDISSPPNPQVLVAKHGITILYKVAVEDDANPAVYGTATEHDNSTDDPSSRWIEAINIDNTPELYPLILTPNIDSEDIWGSGVPKINTECEPYASINIVDNSALIYLQHNDIPQGVLNCTLDVLPSGSSVESDSLLEEKFEFSIFSLHDESVIDAGLRPTVSDEDFKTEETRFEYLSFDKPQTYYDVSYQGRISDSSLPKFRIEEYSQVELYYRVPNILLRVNTSSIIQESDIISLSVESDPWFNEFEDELCSPKFNQSLPETPEEDCVLDTSTLSLNYFGSKVIQSTIWIVSEGESTDELQMYVGFDPEFDYIDFTTIQNSEVVSIDGYYHCLGSGNYEGIAYESYYCNPLAFFRINNPTSTLYEFSTNDGYDDMECYTSDDMPVFVAGCFYSVYVYGYEEDEVVSSPQLPQITFKPLEDLFTVYSAGINYDDDYGIYYPASFQVINIERDIETTYEFEIMVPIDGCCNNTD